MSNNKKQTITSANQAYKNFLEESGQTALPKAEQLPFKNWLEQVKNTGALTGLLPAAKDTLNNISIDKFGKDVVTVSEPKKSFKPLGLNPVVFTIGSVVVVSLLVYAGYNIYKGIKANKA